MWHLLYWSKESIYKRKCYLHFGQKDDKPIYELLILLSSVLMNGCQLIFHSTYLYFILKNCVLVCMCILGVCMCSCGCACTCMGTYTWGQRLALFFYQEDKAFPEPGAHQSALGLWRCACFRPHSAGIIGACHHIRLHRGPGDLNSGTMLVWQALHWLRCPKHLI